MVVDAREPNGYTNNENINNEVMSEIYKAQIKRGLELELCIVDRLVGLVDGFEGFQHRNRVRTHTGTRAL